MERIIYKEKLKEKLGLEGGVWIMKLRGSVYFLEGTKWDSIDLLRTATNYANKSPPEFYKIIHDNYLKGRRMAEKTQKTKQKHYVRLRIDWAERKIVRLEKEIGKIKREIIKLKKAESVATK